MTRRRSPGQKKHTEPQPWRGELVGLLVLAGGFLSLLCLLPISPGALSLRWASLLRRSLGGWGAYIISLAAMVGGLLILVFRDRWQEGLKRRLLSGILLYLSILGLIHLSAGAKDALALAGDGGGGGYLGWVFSALLVAALGEWGALLVLALAGVVSLLFFTEVSLADLKEGWEVARRAILSLRPVKPSQERRTLPPEAVSKRGVSRPSTPRREPRVEITPLPKVEEKPIHTPVITERLPSLDVLEKSTPTAYGEADVERKAGIIEETLASFGVPTKVVDYRRGPTVTQFWVEPGYIQGPSERRVRVSKIVSLSKDLALALAAAPIRIQAPIPGRSVLGIEVPNTEVALVTLRGVMESEAFQRDKETSSLAIALGKDVSGQAVVANLANMPHLLIAGTTNSGKSVCLGSIITCLLFQNPPSRLRLLLIDPKRVELTHFSGIPHLEWHVISDAEEAIGALRRVVKEMEGRYKKFAEVGARNLDHFNALQEGQGGEPLPRVVVAIDELAELMMFAPDEIERLVCRLAQLARATGIHLVIATQRPSVEVVTGLIKANFPARISFAVSSQIDSRVILDTGGAETLLGRGDMLYLAPDSSHAVRLQGCFVSDREISRVVAFWQKEAGAKAEESLVPWEEVEEIEEEGEDDLLAKAIDLIKRHNRASASFLQRRLHIGYPRAARLMDQLEEMGYVGPQEAGGRSREVLIRGEPFGEE